MLKGLYDFSPISPKTLGFEENERLLYLSGVNRDENWLRVSNIRGHIGLVPINYVDVGKNITASVVIDFLDESLQVARREKSSTLSELQEIRRNILNPANDLERRLKEFKQLITFMKASHSDRNSSCSNISNTSGRAALDQNPAGTVSPRQSNNGSLNGIAPLSFLTCEDPHQIDDPMTSPRVRSRLSSVKSSRSSLKRRDSAPFVQYVNPMYDNESRSSNDNNPQPPRGGEPCTCSMRSSGDSGSSTISRSNESSVTYTCSKSSRNKSVNLWNSSCRSPPSPPLATLPEMTRRSRPDDNSSYSPEQQSNNIANYRHLLEQKKLCSLIETVRHNTGISHEDSQRAVQTVLEFLKENSSNGKVHNRSVHAFLKQLELPGSLHKSESFIRNSPDYERLYLILCELSAQAQEDEWQHCSHEQDESSSGSLESILMEMNGILNGADRSTVIKALQEEDYENVYNLTLYFQKEPRWSRRKLLIQAFAKIASIDMNTLSVLLNSLLPIELGREIKDNSYSKSDSNCNRLETAGSLLGLLLSTGEKLPVRHLEFLGKDFLNIVFDKIDQANENFGDVTNVLINLVLAYNLQFGSHDENLTIATLASRRNAKFLTQKIVHLLLWEQDPIAVVATHHRQSTTSSSSSSSSDQGTDSVLKLLLEMFTCSMTADLFYTNDTKVLIDIVIRSLTNWEPGERKRTLYLQLIRVIIRNSNFGEHHHRKEDLVKIFTSILLEEDPLAVPDQKLIREITTEFPSLIK